jgi:hypothetical protein
MIDVCTHLEPCWPWRAWSGEIKAGWSVHPRFLGRCAQCADCCSVDCGAKTDGSASLHPPRLTCLHLNIYHENHSAIYAAQPIVNILISHSVTAESVSCVKQLLMRHEQLIFYFLQAALLSLCHRHPFSRGQTAVAKDTDDTGDGRVQSKSIAPLDALFIGLVGGLKKGDGEGAKMPFFDDKHVHLTREPLADGGLTCDEVIVAPPTPIMFGNSDSIRARQQSPSERRSQQRASAPHSKPARASTPLHRPTPNPPSAARPTARAADGSHGTPSRSARMSAFFIRDEVRDSQSPPPSSNHSAQQQQPHPTPESSTRSLRSRPTPNNETPERMEWTVEKVATALAALAEEVGQGHARLVEYVLEEADKKAPQPRHLSTIDVFAAMKSKAIDNTSAQPPPEETMAVKFKASCPRATLSALRRALTLSAAAQWGIRQVKRQRAPLFLPRCLHQAR